MVEAIGLGLKGLKFALVLLEFAARAICFSSTYDFYGLEIFDDQLEIALFNEINGVDAKLFGANGIDTRLSALKDLGARVAST